MKKILTIFTILVLALTLVSCNKKSAEIEDVASKLEVLFGDPDNVKAGFKLPTEFEHGVLGTWVSSDEDFLSVGEKDDTGMVQVTVTRPDHDKGNKKVKLTANLVLKKKTGTWDIDLTIVAIDAPAYLGDSFSGITKETAGKAVEVKNVSVAGKLGKAGYYLATQDGKLAYVHGQTTMPAAGKLYTLTAEVDNYYNSLQLKNVNFKETTGTPSGNVDYETKTFAEVVGQPLPSKENVYGSPAFKLKNVKLHLESSITDAKYNLFLVREDHSGKIDATNSIMVYYETTIYEALKQLQKTTPFINEINVVLEGYRTDKNVWYVSVIEEESDIKLSAADYVTALQTLLTIKLPTLKYNEEALTLITEKDDVTITWATNNADVIAANGEVSFANERVTVKLTATATKGTATATREFTIDVTEFVTLAEAKTIAKKEVFKVSGIVLGLGANNTVMIQDETGGLVLYGKTLAGAGIEIGQYVEVSGEKDLYNGLHQVKNYTVIKAEETTVKHTVTDLSENSLDENDLLNLQSTLVTIEGLIVKTFKKDKYDNIEMNLLRLDGEEIYFKHDSRTLHNDEVLAGLKPGDYIDLTGVVLGWANKPMLSIVNNESVSLNIDDSTELKLEIAKVLIELQDQDIVEEKTLVLPSKSNNIDVVWTFKDSTNTANTLVNLTTGVVSVEKGKIQEVVIVGTMTLGEKTVTKEITLNIMGINIETFEHASITADPKPSYTTSVKYTSNGVAWDIVGRTDLDIYAISGGGIMMRQAKDNAYIQATFTDGLDSFSFEYMKAFTGENPRKYQIDITNNGETTTIVMDDFGAGSGAQDTIYKFEKSDLGLEGEVIVKIYVVGDSGNQATFDNFIWE